MMFLDELYQKSVADSERNLTFWEDYLNDLKELDFDVFAEKLKVPTLVPIGSKIFFRGELKHTNEVTVSLGADYFVKCSIKQAEILRQHRLKDAQLKVDLYKKEKEYLENGISFTKQNVHEKEGQEILEMYSEEEDKAWRQKHKENVRKYKQEKAKERKEKIQKEDNITDKEIWERLEELELQEELENDLKDNNHETVDHRKQNTFLVNEETLLLNSYKKEILERSQDKIQTHQRENTDVEVKLIKNDGAITIKSESSIMENRKHGLLQQVLNKQYELENKLYEIKSKEKEQSKTEQDLISRIDEMEELDELEDEMERLDDIIQTEDVETEEESIESEEDTVKSHSTKLKKSISFADNNDSETLEISFTHSDTEPNKEPFNPKSGISKPSDLYEAHSHLFDNKTTSILKKSKYEAKIANEANQTVEENTRQVKFEETVKAEEPEQISVDRTIVIKDVVEKVGVNQHKIEGGARPTSLFKKKRMLSK